MFMYIHPYLSTYLSRVNPDTYMYIYTYIYIHIYIYCVCPVQAPRSASVRGPLAAVKKIKK